MQGEMGMLLHSSILSGLQLRAMADVLLFYDLRSHSGTEVVAHLLSRQTCCAYKRVIARHPRVTRRLSSLHG